MPAVVRLAQLFNTNFLDPKARAVDADDFLDCGFQRLLDEEFKPKKLAHKPAPVSYVGDEVPQAAEIWERADALFCALE